MAKLERFIFYIFIFAIPFQTRIILKSWGSDFNEWNSAFLYGTDILLAVLFIFWGRRSTWKLSFQVGKSVFKYTRSTLALLVFLVICGLSWAVADNPALSFYRLIKILEFVGLYYYIRSEPTLLGNGVSKESRFFLVVALSGFFQAVIAIAQSFFQRSLSLKWLGESVLRTNFNAVAVVPVEGEKFLRAYGTLPHPNLLAVFLVFVMFLAILFYLSPKKVNPFLFWGFYAAILFALLATFSRMTMGVSFAVFLVYLIKKTGENKNIIKIKKLFLATGLMAVLFVFLFSPQVLSRLRISAEEQAVSSRIFYNSVGQNLIKNRPWLGVGPGNFVSQFQASRPGLPFWTYQPAHNFYLLIASEIGLLGLGAFLAFLFFAFKKNRRSGLAPLFFAFLMMGFFDHFFWTLQQGQLIFWLILGLTENFSRKMSG